jgi:ketosteroid isomerase-like protein
MDSPEHGTLSRIALRGRERRPLDDRLAVRFPGLFRRLAAWLTPLTLRLPRHWWLRRLLIEWAYWRSTNAFRRGDLELLRVVWHPDCIWDQSHFEGWPHARVYRGHEGLAAFVAEWGDAWGEGGGWPDAFSVEEFEGGVFLADGRLRGVGRGSGAAVELDVCNVAELRDGLFWRVENFTDRAQAVEAARACSHLAAVSLDALSG